MLIKINGTSPSASALDVSKGAQTTTGTSLLMVKASGNVGIGTNNPARLLQLGSSSFGNSALLRWAAGNGGANRSWDLGVQVAPTNLGDATGEYYDFAIRDASANATRLLVDWGSGNVGINTSAPGWKLDVAGNLRVANGSGEFYVNNFSSAIINSTTLLGTFNGANGNGPQLRFSGVTGAGFMDIGQNAVGDFIVEGNDQPRLTVLNDGNVGVGTTTPSQALDVNGGILARAHSAVSLQGAYLHWNRTNGDGATWLLNQKGGGGAAAGIRFGAVSTANAVTEWGRFLDNGNFGLGTTNPLYTLDVATPASLISRLSGSHVGGTWWSIFNTSTGGGGFHFINTGSGNGEGANKLLVTTGVVGSNTGYLITMDGDTHNVGIGTPSPGARLHVAGTMKIDGTNFLELGAGVAGKEANAGKIGYRTFSPDALDIVGAGSTNANRVIRFYAEGGAIFNGPVTGVGAFNTSDARFKTKVRPLGGALAAVLALRGVRYQWNALGVQHGGRAGAAQVGLIAQEVEAIYPELVHTGPDGYKAVNYAQLAPVLIEAIKELKAENEALKARAATTEAQTTAALESLAQRLRALEAGGGQARK